ncbi:MAG: gliding motility-associated C-terminal domain-containing protein [Bacteroidetes bacterium]|nr:gliding motility-associated C-terminal domain-containing protein [Bacteroidota bacterium]
MRISALFICLLVLTQSLAAQKQANRWYFCEQAGLDFTSGEPVQLFDGQLISFEGCVSWSDDWGNHLFYSNGGGRDPDQAGGYPAGTIWNRDHDVMYDMSYTEGGGWSAHQSSLVVPNPADPDHLYYLFTMEEIEYDAGGSVPGQAFGRGLSYFEIDMELNAGLGGVSIADERVHVPLYEALSGTIHGNGCDYWVLVADWANQDPDSLNRFGTLQVTQGGVSDISWQQMPADEALGSQLKISPDGKWIICGLRLFEFDNNTGEITPTGLYFGFPAGTIGWASSFSPNSRYIYYRIGSFSGGAGEIVRFDLEASDILASQESIGLFPSDNGAGQMQIGPDGNIYFIDTQDFGSGPRLSVIRCPNSETPSLQAQIFTFPGNLFINSYGLPNFMDHIFKSDQPGILDIGPDTLYICAGNTYQIGGETAEGGYLWNSGEEQPYLTINEPGTYILTAAHNCGMVSDTLVALDPQTPNFSIVGPDQICPGESIELEVIGLECYQTGIWSTDETGPVIQVNQSGVYSYGVENNCGDTTFVEWEVAQTDLPSVEVMAQTLPPYCEGDQVLLFAEAENETELLWSVNETSYEILVEESGLYAVEVTNACGAASDSLLLEFEFCPEAESDSCQLELPTAFSPNQDGLNDFFGLVQECTTLLDFRIEIYSRWGQLVFESDDPLQKWNGQYKGAPGPEDVYVWKMYVFLEDDEEGHTFSGEVVLLR